jgi:hypothetical protein
MCRTYTLGRSYFILIVIYVTRYILVIDTSILLKIKLNWGSSTLNWVVNLLI